jgi:DNA polymerase-3 subunit alpha
MYIPLKVTTDYSLLKSLIKVSDLINFCVQNKIDTCGICDTNLFGVIEFYKTAKKNDIKPIIGLEITLLSNKVYLYAKNYDGYKNMLKINTIICERDISIYELEGLSSNILVVVPYKSISIYDEVKNKFDTYISYENEDELKNSLIKSNNVVYMRDIKALKKEDIKYLAYLDKLAEREEKNYNSNYYDNYKLSEFDIKSINHFVSLINIEMPSNKRYIPIFKKDVNSLEYLSNLCLKGLKKRLKNKVTKEYLDRLKYELKVINKMGFIDYFLIVYDYVLYAKKHNILVGPGRGSAAGSLVSFVIGITDIDPIKYNLLFERFLNYERVTMPDIDIDFDNTKRDEVISYVKERYGSDCVSGGITFATFKTRLVIRDLSKIFKIDERLISKFLHVIDKDLSLKDNLKNKQVMTYLDNYKELKELYNIAMHLEGLKKNISTHAAGIVIADRSLDEIIPMYKNGEVYLTGVTMEYLEDLGLLKMDFLALKNLSTISNILKNIPGLDLNKIPLDDKSVYELFSSADTDGIFQFETRAFKNMLTKYKPHNFNELVASIALVRPGPQEELETYIKRKEGKEKVTYYHDDLKPILEETYGVIVYQEQVINILVKMASFSYAEADNIRRAMSKKKEELLLSYKEEFISRCLKNKYDKELSLNIFNHILKFASYGFNKAHSVSYAYISYQMAYLKVHYNSLFTFELLNNSLGSIELTKTYINDLKKHKLTINKVSITNSTNEFVLKDNNVYLPFKLIKNLKSDTIKSILNERENGLFTDVFDFFKRTYNILTKNEYVMLINAFALEEFNYNLKTLINNLDSLINYGSLSNELGEYALKPEIIISEEYDIDTLRVNELNSYGFYISNHPASKYSNKEVIKLENINNYLFKNIVCYVMIENVKKIKTKKNEDMAFVLASDETGVKEFTVFPNSFAMLDKINKNDVVKIWGNVSKRYDKVNIIVNKIVKE